MGVTEEQCLLLASWLDSAEAMALWKIRRLEILEAVGPGDLRYVQVGSGSLWLGDSACMCYPMGGSRVPGPASMLRVLKQDLMSRWRIQDEVAEGCRVSDHFAGGP